MQIMRRFITGTIVILCVIVAPVSPSWGNDPLAITSAEFDVPLDRYLEFLKDSEKKYSLDDVIFNTISEEFVNLLADYPIFTFSSAAYWIRFRVNNNLPTELEWFLEISNPQLNSINLYVLDENYELASERVAGDRFPFRQREILHRNFVFRLIEKPMDRHIYILRVQTESLLNLSLTARSSVMFAEKNYRDLVALGVYFGAMLVMIVYNLFIYFSLRDRSYLFYVLYYSVYTLFHFSMSGLAFQYFWPGSPRWAAINLPLLLLVCVILLIQFTRTYLEIKQNYPELDRILDLLTYSSLICLPMAFIVSHSILLRLVITLMFITAVIITASLVKMLRKGFRPARFYLVSWIFVCTGTAIYILRSFSVIPMDFMTMMSFQAASLIEVVTITLGLADRINFMKIQSENLNIELEGIIDRRTEELNEALVNMKKKDKVIQKELDLARHIQEGILPKTPYTGRGIRIDSYYRAMGKVSGDFFDIFPMSNGYLGVIIGDVSGHGMPAAFITAMAKINFSEAAQNKLFPSEIFRAVNSNLVNIIKTDDFLTAFYVVISPSFEIFYGNASHQMPMLLRSKDLSVERLDTNGLFLGALPEANSMFVDGRDQLSYGDRLFLFTDGMTEARNRSGETFGDERLQRLLIETCYLKFDNARQRIVNEWKEFTRGTEQLDDVCFVLIEVDPGYRMLVTYREDGFQHLIRNRPAEAIQLLNKALEIDRNDDKTHLYLGECHLKSKNYLKAVEHLSRYLTNNEIDANVWFHLAQAYFNLGDYVMANKTALKAAQIRNESTDVLIISGLSLRDLGQHDEAEKIWKRLLSIEPENQLALFELENISNIKKSKH